MLKLGILGLGKMGQLHFQNALRMNGVQVVAVADTHKATLKRAKAYHVQTYTDYTDLLASTQLNAVVISLPNFLRETSIQRAAETNLDIFVDKPLARSHAEGTRIVNTVRREGVRLMTGVNYRYIESVQVLKRLLDEGRIGDAVLATSALILNGPFSHALNPRPVPNWWFDKTETGGGALLDLGYHLLDLLNWMLGDLHLEYSSLGYRYHLPIEDAATLVLKSEKTQTTCNVNVGWFSKSIPPDFNFRVNLHGTVGYASTDHYAPRNLYVHAVKAATQNLFRKALGRKLKYLSYTYYYPSFYQILEHFVESIRTDAENPVAPDDQLDVLRIIDAVYKRHGVTSIG